MNILVTAIGSFSADCVINTLRKNGHFIVGCDIYPSKWHAVSRDCDVVYQVPFATKEREYIDTLIEICNQHHVEFVFPLTDLEIDVLNKHRQEFEDRKVLLCIQSNACLEVARDKYKMYCLFKDSPMVNVPQSTSSCNLTDDFPLPAIAKPINGRSSEGIQRIYNNEELLRMKEVENYIVQELLEGNIYTIDYVRNSSTKSDFAIPREELLRTKNGAGTTVRIVPNDYLMHVSSYIGNKLDLNGCVNMEFIHHANTFYLIDINPRFSAGVAFSNFVGYDMVTSHLNCFVGNKDIMPPINYGEQYICKKYVEISL